MPLLDQYIILESPTAQDAWTWEIATGALCIALLATIAGILFGYDGKPTPSLPESVTINAIISVLSTLAKGCLLVVVAAALRQERWLHFSRNPAALSITDEYEEASRGPWGSMLLGVKARGSLRALLLAAVTVLAFGFEAFLQQLIILEPNNVPVHDLRQASIRTPTAYNETSALVSGTGGGSRLVLAASIGAFGGASGAIPQPLCPTGNCTWPEYNTLAMCSVCEDTTDQVTVEGSAFSNETNFNDVVARYAQNANSSTTQNLVFNATFRVPTGNSPTINIPFNLAGSDPVNWNIVRPRRYTWSLDIDPTPDSHWTRNWQNKTFAGVDGPLYSMGYLDMDLNEDHSRMVLNQAVECALTPCVRTQQSVMQNYVLDSAINGTNYGSIEMSVQQPDGFLTSGWRASVNGTDFAVVDNGLQNYDGSANDFVRSLRIVLEGNSTYTRAGTWYGNNEPQNNDYDITTSSQTSSPWSSPGQQAIDGNGNFTYIAEQVGRAVTGKLQELQNLTLSGTVLRSEVIVRVRWAWLAGPLVLILLGLGGLAATILATKRNRLPVWKDSLLPLLLRFDGNKDGLNERTEVGWERLNAASSITKEAESKHMHLIRVQDSPQEVSLVWLLAPVSSEKELQSMDAQEIGVAR
ncbi:uncharacterized protein HMPREF1541_08102 [Cyphellophora europaea CBS 101466]|uniref:Uncharacterized protein n=1 Tax=Cyphellophora europaea (strain CBS 101466) TaxID=1220924 RepID=W2RKU1_CYPE1|nr:uncharacterized protein HMPREF1541_08102 [Cyphellophora europaea CBS 101466]ETN37112.1 hypothetical protein HMPREF1541_08102 [Cyphellophora europaea CBS 101466]